MAAPRPDRLATGPFKLVETPVHSQNSSKPYDPFVEGASIMALSHNVLVRGLNSIYRQAPHIAPDDASDFISYSQCWAEVLDGHHAMEEKFLFPEIEKTSGEVGIMEANVEQHHAFLPGLEAFKTYLKTTSSSPSTFSGKALTTLIDDFAPLLFEHLEEEIPTLLSLSRFGTKVSLLQMVEKSGTLTALHQSITGGTPFFFRNLDLDFEDGLWKNWPPVPGPVWFFMQNTFVAWHSSWWRFASADAQGRLQELHALKDV